MSILDTAQSVIGMPYVFGGPLGRVPGDVSGCDCSGFVSYVFGQNGISLNAFTDSMFDQTQPGDSSEPAFGDLLFYEYQDSYQPGTRFPHVAIALGNNQTIDCKSPGGVSIHPPLNLPYEVRRVAALGGAQASTGDAAAPGDAPAPGGPPWLLIGIGSVAAFLLLFGRRNPHS